MANIDHVTNPEQRRRIARNLQVHAWIMASINNATVFDLGNSKMVVDQGIYKPKGKAPTANSTLDLAQYGRAVTYRVVNKATGQLSPEKIFDVAQHIRTFFPHDKIIIEYDQYDPTIEGDEVTTCFTIHTPEIPADYVSASFKTTPEVATTYNGYLLSGELVDLEQAAGSFKGGSGGQLSWSSDARARQNVVYANQGKVRGKKVQQLLLNRLQDAVTAVYGSNALCRIYSGGQMSLQSLRAVAGPNAKYYLNKKQVRTGTIRHDDGYAADCYIYKGGTFVGNTYSGYTQVGTAGTLQAIENYWLQNNYGSVGKVMNGGGIHLDIWGGIGGPKRVGGMSATWSY